MEDLDGLRASMTPDELDVVADVFDATEVSSFKTQVTLAGDDRAARFEIALCKYIIESRTK